MTPAPTVTSKPGTLGRTTVGGVVWLLAQTLANRGVGVVSQIALAWLLIPADFGQFGLALSIVLVVGPLTSFGVDDVLLQRSARSRVWAPPAFWTGLIAGLVSMMLVLIAAPFLGEAYRAPRIVGVMAVLAVAIPVASLSTVPMVTLRAQLRFKTLACIGTAEFAGQQALTVALAAAGMGAYAFAIPVLMVATIKAVVLWRMARPSLKVGRLGLFRLLAQRGGSVFLSRILIALRHQGDVAILGLFATQVQVGLYFFALRIAAQPVQMFAGSLNMVLFPALVHLSGDRPRQLAASLNAARTLAFLITPICFMQAAVAEPLLTLLFGAKWAGAVLPIQFLSLGLAFDGVAWVAGALLTARGHFRLGAIYNAVMLAIFVTVVLTSSLSGRAAYAALAVGGFYAVVPPAYSWLVFRRYGASSRDVLGLYFRPTLIAGAAVGTAWAVSRLGPWGADPFWTCAVVGLVGVALYAGLARWLMADLFAQTLTRLLGRFSRPGRIAVAVPDRP
ncbi:oligosaccharide flippase family protein [Brevundimonas sp. NPDC003935]|uniref:oligosaccharide flippase family protein n=1 Tax=unclassified Brevundimonas TaxID=2622653 RepID=UPI00289D6DD3|nr:oligosaccharide flippase family protein [Brevundimonas sp.]